MLGLWTCKYREYVRVVKLVCAQFVLQIVKLSCKQFLGLYFLHLYEINLTHDLTKMYICIYIYSRVNKSYSDYNNILYLCSCNGKKIIINKISAIIQNIIYRIVENPSFSSNMFLGIEYHGELLSHSSDIKSGYKRSENVSESDVIFNRSLTRWNLSR